MHKIFFNTVLIIALFLTACSEKQESTAMKEVMVIHDQTMPRMGELGQLVGKLKAIENDSTEMGIAYMDARKDLQNANEEMMNWMKNFGDQFTPDEIINGAALSKDKVKLLTEEKRKAQQMQQHIENSITNAQNLLDKQNSVDQ